MEHDAIEFRQNNSDAVAHRIKKRKGRNKGLEIEFDPAARKDFVTGFSKRKMQRRKEALRHAAEKEQKQRAEDKAERRAKLREELQLDKYLSKGKAGSEAGAKEDSEEEETAQLDVFADKSYTTVVTTAPLDNSDSEAEIPANEPCKSAQSDEEDIAKVKEALEHKREQSLAAAQRRAQKLAQHKREKELKAKMKAKKSRKKKKKRKHK